MNKNSTLRVNEGGDSAGKKPYRTPRLTEFGHISKLTAGTSGTHTDKGTFSKVHGHG